MLFVQQKQWAPALAHAETLVNMTPGQAGPRQLVENIRRQRDAAAASR
jgi:hypothetical protein